MFLTEHFLMLSLIELISYFVPILSKLNFREVNDIHEYNNLQNTALRSLNFKSSFGEKSILYKGNTT